MSSLELPVCVHTATISEPEAEFPGSLLCTHIFPNVTDFESLLARLSGAIRATAVYLALRILPIKLVVPVVSAYALFMFDGTNTHFAIVVSKTISHE